MEPVRDRIFFPSFQHSNDAIVICDINGILLHVNPAFEGLFGHTASGVVGKNVSLLRHPQVPDKVFRDMWAALRDPARASWRGEIRNRRKDGGAVDVNLNILPIRLESGEIEGYTGIMLDHSNAKQLEARMIQQEKLTSIGMLAAGMAHQIGTPLNVISGRAEMARAMVHGLPGATKALEIIIQQTERIGSLVQALLKFSSPQSPASRENFEWIDLGDVLNECRAFLDESLRRKKIRLAVTTLNNPRLRWDFVSCEQVFLNLLQNAIHAVDGVPDPKIEVIVETAPPDMLRAIEPPPAAGLRVEVRDNGYGISPGNQMRIFDPFFTTKEDGTGTGLGLSVVYGLVNDINGTVSVKSSPGKGTAFVVILPILPE